MACKSSANTHADLIANLEKNGVITDARVRDAMSVVDRGVFVPEPASAYEDKPQRFAEFNANVSAPHMHAISLGLLAANLRPGARVLDLGSGSGYLTCVMAVMVGQGWATAMAPLHGCVAV
jgi:protein-L-isoaspartate(D-aspartate) O-methyltransferase